MLPVLGVDDAELLCLAPQNTFHRFPRRCLLVVSPLLLRYRRACRERRGETTFVSYPIRVNCFWHDGQRGCP
jgi:hypothetical protein